jgi:hypothetical protein
MTNDEARKTNDDRITRSSFVIRPSGIRHSPAFLLAAGLIAASIASTASAVGPIVDANGFEGFALGPLEGQQGWVSSGAAVGSATIQTSVVQSGSKAVAVERGPNVDRRWAKPVTGFPTQRFVVIDWDMRVAPTEALNVFGPFFGVETYDAIPATPPLKVLGSLGVDATTGDVLYQAPGGALTETGVLAAFNAWNNFRIVLDFTGHNYNVFFNGSKLNPSPIGFVDHTLASPLNDFSDADIAALGAAGDPGSMAQTGNAFFDNFVVFDGVPGDFDFNGVVNGADLTVWRGAMGVNANGDADGDADSDGADFLIWQRQLGENILAATATAAAVPEPSALVLGVLALAALSRRGRGVNNPRAA